MVSTAPALLMGLGARILLDLLTRADEPNFRDFILAGCWQGIALWYAFKRRDWAIPVTLLIAFKLFVEYALVQDVFRSGTTVLTTVLGVVSTDFLAGVFDEPKGTKVSSSSSSSKPRKKESSRRSRHSVSDITSVDSNSELIGPQGSMTPIEREVAALRTRASLADSERRRFKEEKKWAVAQGNLELAAQMKWQVKKYSALQKSFHREADAKLVEASHSRHQRVKPKPRLTPIVEEPRQSSSVPSVRSSRPRHNSQSGPHPTVSVNIDPAQLKSAVRVNVR